MCSSIGEIVNIDQEQDRGPRFEPCGTPCFNDYI